MPPESPADRRQKLLADPLYGLPYLRLRDRHKPVSERRELVTKGHTRLCATCRTLWPCEVGQALAVIDWLLVRL
jgi:hypothetical protein